MMGFGASGSMHAFTHHQTLTATNCIQASSSRVAMTKIHPPVWMAMVLPKLGRYSSQLRRSFPRGESRSCSWLVSPSSMTSCLPSRLTARAQGLSRAGMT